MIGLILRALSLDFLLPGVGSMTLVFATFLACCTVFGIYNCSKVRMRDCSCVKKFMRATGADGFDDFELTVLVHETYYLASRPKMRTLVRVAAGAHSTETSVSNNGIFQQPLSLLVEQGSETINVDVLDANDRTVIAALKLSAADDIVLAKDIRPEQVFTMKQKSKGVLNPRIKLTLHLGKDEDAEKGLLAGMCLSKEAGLTVRRQLHKTTDDEEIHPCSELEILAKSCAGPLAMFGGWGSLEPVYVAVLGPPTTRKYMLCVYNNEAEFQQMQRPREEVDLMKVLSVQPDADRHEVFTVHYVHSEAHWKLAFQRVDRTRDVWVEILHLLIEKIREERAKNKSRRPAVQRHGP